MCVVTRIKNDCMFATNWDISGWRLIDGVKRAIHRAKHPTAYILSPGNDATLAQGQNVSHVADAFRITADWSVYRGDNCLRPTWLIRVAPQLILEILSIHSTAVPHVLTCQRACVRAGTTVKVEHGARRVAT